MHKGGKGEEKSSSKCYLGEFKVELDKEWSSREKEKSIKGESAHTMCKRVNFCLTSFSFIYTCSTAAANLCYRGNPFQKSTLACGSFAYAEWSHLRHLSFA